MPKFCPSTTNAFWKGWVSGTSKIVLFVLKNTKYISRLHGAII